MTIGSKPDCGLLNNSFLPSKQVQKKRYCILDSIKLISKKAVAITVFAHRFAF